MYYTALYAQYFTYQDFFKYCFYNLCFKLMQNVTKGVILASHIFLERKMTYFYG